MAEHKDIVSLRTLAPWQIMWHRLYSTKGQTCVPGDKLAIYTKDGKVYDPVTVGGIKATTNGGVVCVWTQGDNANLVGDRHTLDLDDIEDFDVIEYSQDKLKLEVDGNLAKLQRFKQKLTAQADTEPAVGTQEDMQS